MGSVCYGCFSPLKGDENICPYCGYPVREYTGPVHILKPGTILNQKYTLGKTLGEGGFGITYLAWDNNMQTKIAIKEFYPASLVMRDTTAENNTQIYTITKSHSNEFHSGMERFVKEASVLAKFFNLPGIVSVKDFFYENGTAYIVMEYIEGITLKEYLKQRGGRLSVEETLTLMKPVMESLAIVHREKMLHRDISPDNLMVSADFQVKLIDFGSARYYDSQSDKSMTVVLKHGYAPIEQYSSNGNQGTWTDVYSLCATMYRMLTGKVPDEAINRVRNDNLESLDLLVRKIPKNINEAIKKGLSVMPENRQQTVSELYHELYISKQDLRIERRNKAYQNINRFLIRLIIILILFIAVGIFAWIKRKDIQSFRSRLVSSFSNDESDGEMEERMHDAKQDSEDENEEGSDAKETNTAKKSREENNVKEYPAEEEAAKEEETAPRDTVSDAPISAPEEAPAADAGMQAYEFMRSGAESVSQTDSAVVKVRDGKLNNIAADYTVGEILDLYSETEGIWYAYEDPNSAQTYIYYEGQRAGEPFVLEFEVYANDTFKLTGAAQNNIVLERYSDFFQSILDSLGL